VCLAHSQITAVQGPGLRDDLHLSVRYRSCPALGLSRTSGKRRESWDGLRGVREGGDGSKTQGAVLIEEMR
jgi:hypothetical protein